MPDDAMDIDMTTPPATTVSPPPAPTSTAKEPRMYTVDVSQMHQTNASTPSSTNVGNNQNKRESSGTFQTKLNDLGNALQNPSGGGLAGLKDISSTLPFPSKASSSHPLRSFTPRELPLPNLPRAPEAPSRLSKASWQTYCSAFSAYLAKFQTFNATILNHLNTRHMNAEALIISGTRALEAAGMSTAPQASFPAYVQGVKEDERVREHWNLGCERHSNAVDRFAAVRDRVRDVTEKGPGLPDV